MSAGFPPMPGGGRSMISAVLPRQHGFPGHMMYQAEHHQPGELYYDPTGQLQSMDPNDHSGGMLDDPSGGPSYMPYPMAAHSNIFFAPSAAGSPSPVGAGPSPVGQRHQPGAERSGAARGGGHHPPHHLQHPSHHLHLSHHSHHQSVPNAHLVSTAAAGSNASSPSAAPNPVELLIREVWADDLEDAMSEVRQLIKTYKWIGMDTEFPGVVARPLFHGVATDFHYQTLRSNVDLLRIIQLGLTFSDGNGNYPTGTITYQFNFRFDLDKHMFAEESIKLLERSGINFQKHRDHGIKPSDFGELLMTSGLVMFDTIHWISFHSAYDFAYLIKLLTCSPLPAEQSKFLALLHLYFPKLYDIKVLMKSCKNLKGGLESLASMLEVKRIGPQHQAGSDSLLTSAVFFKMLQIFFDNTIDRQFSDVLYGIGKS